MPKPPACQEVWRAASVFAGTVVQIEEINGEPKVTLAVTEPFTGLDAADKQVDIFTASGAPACGFHFERGRSYLVYTHKSDGALHTSHCMRTALLENAAEDLAYLRSLSTRKAVGQITGVVHGSQARAETTWVSVSPRNRFQTIHMKAGTILAFTIPPRQFPC